MIIIGGQNRLGLTRPGPIGVQGERRYWTSKFWRSWFKILRSYNNRYIVSFYKILDVINRLILRSYNNRPILSMFIKYHMIGEKNPNQIKNNDLNRE
jgi:hypothetical protein